MVEKLNSDLHIFYFISTFFKYNLEYVQIVLQLMNYKENYIF